MRNFSYSSMGTGWEITIWDEIPSSNFENIKDEVMQICKDFDETYSRFKETSLVWKIAREKGVYTVPEDFMLMLQMYMNLYPLSQKKLNPLIGFTISDLGYDKDYSLVPRETIRQTPDLFDTVKILSGTEIETKEKVLFDFGALGKGYAVDKVGKYLKERGLEKFMVNGSGDIYYQGYGNITVGLEDPDDNTKVIGKIEMASGAMCASGTNRRKWRNYHHVIDPNTSLSTKGVSATWVIAESAAMADALASCLFFVPPEDLAKFKFEYCILNEERRIKNSAGFNAEFF